MRCVIDGLKWACKKSFATVTLERECLKKPSWGWWIVVSDIDAKLEFFSRKAAKLSPRRLLFSSHSIVFANANRSELCFALKILT